MRNALRFLRSLWLSLVLMLFLIPVIAAGNLIPQIGREAPWDIAGWQQRNPLLSKATAIAGLDHVYTSWWFLLVFTALCLNMTIVTWDLVQRMRLKARGLHRFSQEASSFYALGQFPFDTDALSALEKALHKRRYGISKTGGEIYARKGWIGIWGGTILHVGFVVLLLGAVVSGLTRFSGYTEAGVGQSFKETGASFLQASHGPLFPGHRPHLTIKVLDIQEKDLGKMKSITTALAITDGESPVASQTVRMNEPLYYRGLKVYQSRLTGPALLFAIETPGSPHPSAGYVNLRETAQASSSVFPLRGTPFQAKAVYRPGRDWIDLEVRDRSELVYRGPLKVGQTISDGIWRITLAAINRWTGINVVYDWAVPVIFLGFFLAILGIAIMGLFDPREIWARTVESEQGHEIKLLGWGRWRNMFLDEYHEILKDVPAWNS